MKILLKNSKIFLAIFIMIFTLFSCEEEEKEKELVCKDGYILNEDSKRCDNINDCKPDSCPENSECRIDLIVFFVIVMRAMLVITVNSVVKDMSFMEIFV